MVVVAAVLAAAVVSGAHGSAALASGGWSQPTTGVPIPPESAAAGMSTAAGEACASAVVTGLRSVWERTPDGPLDWLTTSDHTSVAAGRTRDDGGGATRRRLLGPDWPRATGRAELRPVPRCRDAAAGSLVLGRGPPPGRV